MSDSRAWVDALIESAEELAVSALGFDGVEVGEITAGLPDGVSGAYVALVGDADSLQFGVVGAWESCHLLACSLLMMEPDEELSDDDMADAINEVANIVGGGVKRRMAAVDASLKLGLPMFIKGSVLPTSHLEAWSVPVTMGPVGVELLMLRHRT